MDYYVNNFDVDCIYGVVYLNLTKGKGERIKTCSLMALVSRDLKLNFN